MINFEKEFTNHKEFRDYFQECIRKELHGPMATDDENFRNAELNISPAKIFSMGMLFPRDFTSDIQLDNTGSVIDEGIDHNFTNEDIDEVLLENVNGTQKSNSNFSSSEEIDSIDDINLSNQFQPSSIGITFSCVESEQIEAEIYFATYKKIKNEETELTKYKREEHSKIFLVEVSEQDFLTTKQFENTNAEIKFKLRKKDDFYIVTFWLVNQSRKSGAGELEEKIIFQPKISVKSKKFSFIPIGNSNQLYKDEDTSSNSLLYRDKKAFCRGHGCAGDWEVNNENNCSQVFSNLFPDHEIRPIVHSDLNDHTKNIDLSFLGNSLLNEDDTEAKNKIIQNLKNFVNDYSEWIRTTKQKISSLDDRYKETANSHMNKCSLSLERMNKGIQLLEENPQAFFSFRLANYAMLLQQIHGSLRSRNLSDQFVKPDPLEETNRKWRPFQLAFLLLNLRGVPAEPNYDKTEADIVDLIWFPTGGGKTEAYLGVAAYSIILSRLNHGDMCGTEVIMRYTLRLLTAQQFERASCLILALEYLRNEGFFKNEQIKASDKQFVSGLWVGDTLTPNKTESARKILGDMRDGRDSNKFVIIECPWCKTSLEENRFAGYFATKSKFKFRCQEEQCHFYGNIPIQIIDEELYQTPPTLLLGTVDKFAQISWRSEPSIFLGKNGKTPCLIIQDELHLISGPLGSVVGHYEVLLKMIMEKNGNLPKIIASTATIRRAKEQVYGLYRTEHQVFPPQGIDYDDSYFAREAKDINEYPGRRYVGIFCSGTKSHIFSQVKLLSPIIQFPTAFFKNKLEPLDDDTTGLDDRKLSDNIENEFIDPYGTVVWYFNTLRELGYADNLINEDISQQLKILCKRYDIPVALRKRPVNTREMTSRAKENEISEILNQLKINWRPSRYHKSIDVLSSTNMISVGVDIDRLGLMVITGQPKNTSEYIQASSRVGRKYPGLVLTLYNHTRSRDRSHFETFKTYHQSIYKHVEPTSITPFSYKSRERSLPGLIIGFSRVNFDINDPKQILEKEEDIKEKLEEYFKILSNFDLLDDDIDVARSQVEDIFNKWKKIASDAAEAGENVEWKKINNGNDFVLIEYGKKTEEEDNIDPVGMLTSMRNVDVAATLRVATSDQEASDGQI